jgi:hypothetical protein
MERGRPAGTESDETQGLRDAPAAQNGHGATNGNGNGNGHAKEKLAPLWTRRAHFYLPSAEATLVLPPEEDIDIVKIVVPDP